MTETTNKRVVVVDDRRQRDVDFCTLLAKTVQRVGKTETNRAILEQPEEFLDHLDRNVIKALFPPARESKIAQGSWPPNSPYAAPPDDERLCLQQTKQLLPRFYVLAGIDVVDLIGSTCGTTTSEFTLQGHAENLYGDKCWQQRKHKNGEVKTKFKLPRRLKKELKKTVVFLNQPGWNTVEDW